MQRVKYNSIRGEHENPDKCNSYNTLCKCIRKEDSCGNAARYIIANCTYLTNAVTTIASAGRVG